MAKAKEPKKVAQKWNRNLKGATESMRDGVNRVEESPTAQAADKRDKWAAKMAAKETQDKWEARLRSVDLNTWRNAYLNTGINRVASGVDAAQPDMEQFMGELLPHVQDGQRAIEELPDVTIEDSIARMTNFIRHMAKFKRK